MGLSNFARRILPTGSFPRLGGQEAPDPMEVVIVPPPVDDRTKDQGRQVKPPKPVKPKPL